MTTFKGILVKLYELLILATASTASLSNSVFCSVALKVTNSHGGWPQKYYY